MEYILDWELIDENDVSSRIEEWETPYILEKNHEGLWTSKKVTDNGEHGYMREEILSKVAVWTYKLESRDIAKYHVEFVMVDGTKIVGERALGLWFDKLKESEVA